MLELDKYFARYRNICKKITTKELELESLREEISISSSSYSEKTSSSMIHKGLEYVQIKIENLEEELVSLNYQKQEIKDEYIEDFKILSKEEYEIILTSYFLDKISIKSISIKLGHSDGYIKKMKREAIKELLDKVVYIVA